MSNRLEIALKECIEHNADTLPQDKYNCYLTAIKLFGGSVDRKIIEFITAHEEPKKQYRYSLRK
jgi:hypothetical protein